MPRKLFQLSLKSFFAATFIVAALLATDVVYGWPGVVLCGITIVAMLAVRVINNQLIRLTFVGIAVLSVWCLLVHRLWDGYECPVCGLTVENDKMEIFTIPIGSIEINRSPTLITLIAADLGFPCAHNDTRRTVWEDYWGARICIDRVNGIIGLTGDVEWERWYRRVIRPRVSEVVKDHPELVNEFRQRVMLNRDRQYFVHFTNDILKIPDYNPH